MAEHEEGTHAHGEKNSEAIRPKEKEMVDEDISVSVEQTTEGVKLNISDNNKKEAVKVEEKMPVEPSASILITSDLKTREVQGNGLIEGLLLVRKVGASIMSRLELYICSNWTE